MVSTFNRCAGEAETTDSLANQPRSKRPRLKKQGEARLENEQQLRLFSDLHTHCYPHICMHIGYTRIHLLKLQRCKASEIVRFKSENREIKTA